MAGYNSCWPASIRAPFIPLPKVRRQSPTLWSRKLVLCSRNTRTRPCARRPRASTWALSMSPRGEKVPPGACINLRDGDASAHCASARSTSHVRSQRLRRGLSRLFVFDAVWTIFYYSAVAESKNAWLLGQALFIAVYLVGAVMNVQHGAAHAQCHPGNQRKSPDRRPRALERLLSLEHSDLCCVRCWLGHGCAGGDDRHSLQAQARRTDLRSSHADAIAAR